MRAVIDTNVLLSGLLWRGSAHAFLEQVRNGTVTILSSPELLAELQEVLARPKFDAILSRSNSSRELMLTQISKLAELTDPPPLPQPMCRDPDDDAVLALAIATLADVIVSGDDDLLSLVNFEGIPILNPVQALQLTLSWR
jgi:putative PIN family toxin of toxin-antitoxin system